MRGLFAISALLTVVTAAPYPYVEAIAADGLIGSHFGTIGLNGKLAK